MPRVFLGEQDVRAHALLAQPSHEPQAHLVDAATRPRRKRDDGFDILQSSGIIAILRRVQSEAFAERTWFAARQRANFALECPVVAKQRRKRTNLGAPASDVFP